ncbi:cysteine--tRNA ligase [Amphibacillus xylanus]|uniref:Cysteine--tRNA ligase n=1 Tax=Amphibacillus xylanus (strain ATCC 51415 / DSM 6626 / JCM 7361 / LMG 17667 / NBRC 15112 / Ep01) TaxID=698758 RepID=K0IV10_AMPXN|nr:cysteine--tRNA ligase [Amphibacillus xylanus]BAM46234.1 cysteinyl-tRNA synthetase [Amphibacillus xylanus NBRC 15112]
MTIKVYNTLTRQKEVFKSIEPNKVKMYVCGPTVYNYIHIGNARPAIVFDTVRRYLEYKGYEVSYLLNFTDVDDKIINEANRNHEDINRLTERFIEAYKEDVGALGVKPATLHPRVTETMDDIIQFIDDLIKKGYAYESNGDVYFKTRKFEEYGKLSAQSLDELKAGARIQVGQSKEDELDFALWKAAKPGEISWSAPWGEGRPGWHIECSAMVKKHLGDTIDIHAGGQDLTFPHHENEIAQSEARNGKNFANYWLHNGYITIEDEKMSKSLGNYILARDLIEKYPPELIRFFMLSVHYRQPINFSDTLITQAKQGFDRIVNSYQNLKYRLNHAIDSKANQTYLERLKAIKGKFVQEMNDDFNTANAISVLYELVKEANLLLENAEVSKQDLEQFIALFDQLFEILGLEIANEEQLLDAEIDQLLVEREKARQEKNFKRADEIRDLLKAQSIILEDTAQGTRWRRG